MEYGLILLWVIFAICFVAMASAIYYIPKYSQKRWAKWKLEDEERTQAFFAKWTADESYMGCKEKNSSGPTVYVFRIDPAGNRHAQFFQELLGVIVREYAVTTKGDYIEFLVAVD